MSAAATGPREGAAAASPASANAGSAKAARTPNRMLAASALAACAMLAACGYRTDPRPPEDTAPVIQKAPQLEITDAGTVRVRWRRATESVDGKRLTDLAGFHVERAATDGEFTTVATIDIADQHKLRQREKFSWVDEQAPAGELRYRVRAFLTDGQQGEPTPAAAIDHHERPQQLERAGQPEPSEQPQPAER